MQRSALASAQIGGGALQVAYFRFQGLQGRGIAAAFGFISQLVQLQELVVDVDQMLCHALRPLAYAKITGTSGQNLSINQLGETSSRNSTLLPRERSEPQVPSLGSCKNCRPCASRDP